MSLLTLCLKESLTDVLGQLGGNAFALYEKEYVEAFFRTMEANTVPGSMEFCQRVIYVFLICVVDILQEMIIFAKTED